MSEIKAKQKQLESIINEIETDKSELDKVPDRFKEIINAQILDKERTKLRIEQEIELLISSNALERLDLIREDFQKMINEFIDNYLFEYSQDKELFINSVILVENDDEISVLIKEKENKTNNNKDRLLVKFPDGSIINEYKTTDTFVECLIKIGIDKVKKLNLVLLKAPLISDQKHERYQQKQIEDGTFILTGITKEKKKEILEFIGKKLNISLKAELING